MKIAELIESYNSIAKKRKKSSFEKQAFVPNPSVPPPQDPAAMQQQGAPPQGAPPQGAPPQGAPPQGAPLPPEIAQMDTSGDGSLMDELMAALQQAPPEVQQQVAPVIQQLQQMPPEQREMQLASMLSQLTGANQQPPQDPAAMQQQAPPQDPAAMQQPGMVAQANEDQFYTDPAAMQQPQESDYQDIEKAQESAQETTNELDNVKVTLSVRELLDLTGKGTATASLLKVKQLADAHQQKMDQNKQKVEAANQKQQQTQQQEQGLNSGGIYPTPMGGA